MAAARLIAAGAFALATSARAEWTGWITKVEYGANDCPDDANEQYEEHNPIRTCLKGRDDPWYMMLDCIDGVASAAYYEDAACTTRFYSQYPESVLINTVTSRMGSFGPCSNSGSSSVQWVCDRTPEALRGIVIDMANLPTPETTQYSHWLHADNEPITCWDGTPEVSGESTLNQCQHRGISFVTENGTGFSAGFDDDDCTVLKADDFNIYDECGVCAQNTEHNQGRFSACPVNATSRLQPQSEPTTTSEPETTADVDATTTEDADGDNSTDTPRLSSGARRMAGVAAAAAAFAALAASLA